ncbi:hypothetical protein VCHA53O466_40427 [Vibrio chagasii]|nr:hypothetical protein VCHA53O466_40427 [Vibrio chagasii]
MLKRNVVNPKYRKLIWFVITIASTALWVPTIFKVNANANGVSFTHFDQELAISCILDESSRGVEWECKENQRLHYDRYNPEAKTWVYDTEHGEVTVTRSISFGDVRLTVKHPRIRGDHTTVISPE